MKKTKEYRKRKAARRDKDAVVELWRERERERERERRRRRKKNIYMHIHIQIDRSIKTKRQNIIINFRRKFNNANIQMENHKEKKKLHAFE